jgi:hypothetical protein
MKMKIDAVNSSDLEKNYPVIYKELPPWMKTFYGCKKLFYFIYDEKS